MMLIKIAQYRFINGIFLIVLSYEKLLVSTRCLEFKIQEVTALNLLIVEEWTRGYKALERQNQTTKKKTRTQKPHTKTAVERKFMRPNENCYTSLLCSQWYWNSQSLPFPTNFKKPVPTFSVNSIFKPALYLPGIAYKSHKFHAFNGNNCSGKKNLSTFHRETLLRPIVCYQYHFLEN